MMLGFGVGFAPRQTVEAGASFTGILDTITATAAAAYSASRRLTVDYTGSLIRVRRSSDNAEADIGYDVNGDLDQTALLAHTGSGGTDNGFIVKEYDQSGNSRDRAQSTTSKQPKIVDAGVVVVKNTKPSPLYDGTDDDLSYTIAATTEATIVLVVALETTSQLDSDSVFASGGAGNGTFQLDVGADGSSWRLPYTTSSGTSSNLTGGATTTDATQHTITVNGSGIAWRQEGAAVASVAGLTAVAFTEYRFGVNRGDNRFNAMRHPEAIIFHSAISTDDRDAIEADQIAEYGV